MYKLPILLFVFFVGSLSLHAQLALEENFSYGTTAGTIPAVSGTNWAFTGTTVAGTTDDPLYLATGLSFTGYAGSNVGGAIKITTAAGRDDIERALSTNYTSGTVYVAFLLNMESATANTAGDYFVHLRDNSSPNSFFNARVYARQASATTYNMQITRTGQSATFSGFTTASFTYGTTYLVVLKYEFVSGTNNDPLNAWVLTSVPATEAAAGAAAISAPVSGSGAADINEIVRFNIRQGANASNGLGVNATIDGIRVGTSWADVVAGAATPTIATAGTLSNFVTPVSTPSAEQSYTVSGSNLAANITVTASSPFEVSLLSEGPYSSSVTVNQFGGNASSTVYVRLNPTVAGPYTGTLTHTSTGATNVVVNLTGSNTAATGIYAVRQNQATYIPAGTVVTVTGRVIANNFNPTELVIQDYSGPSGTAAGIGIFVGDVNYTTDTDRNYFTSLDIDLGDSISVTGPVGEFKGFPASIPDGQGQLQITGTPGGTVTVTKLADATTLAAVQPRVITLSQITEDLEATLVRINSITWSTSDPDFAPGYFRGETTYDIGDATATGVDVRVDINSGLVYDGANYRVTSIPTAATSITGLIGQFSTTFQLRPRTLADANNPSTVTYLSAPNLAVSKANVLEVAIWNIAWFGDATNSPSGSTNTEQKDFAAKIIAANDWDVICNVEIVDATLYAQLVAQVNALKNAAVPGSGDYKGRVVKRGASDQDIAFMWSTADIDSISLGQFINTGDWASGRYPISFEVDFKYGSSQKKRVRIVGLHGKALSTAADRTRRETDYTQLKTLIDGTYPTESIIVVGDWNDLLSGSISGAALNSPMKNFLDDPADYKFLTADFQGYGLSTYRTSTLNSAIDHHMITNELYDQYLFGFTRPYYTENLDNFRGTTSDHYPVVSGFYFDGTTDVTPIASNSKAGYISNYPNPANTQTTLSVALSRADAVTISVVDAAGRVVDVPVIGRECPEGESSFNYDTSLLRPGLYILKADLSRAGATITSRMLIVE